MDVVGASRGKPIKFRSQISAEFKIGDWYADSVFVIVPKLNSDDELLKLKMINEEEMRLVFFMKKSKQKKILCQKLL